MPDEIVIKFSITADGLPKIEQVNQGLGKTKQATEGLVPGLESARKSLTGFVGQNAGLISVLTAVGFGIKKTIDQTVAYADELEKVKRLTGLTAEESSRLVQVSDDLFISQESLNQALTIAGKKYDVSINGIAALSDQYNALETTQEKNAFAAEHFGKNYAEVVKLLEVGGDKIKELAKNQPEGLIFDEQDLQSAKRYKQQLDQITDTFSALKMSAGKDILPFTAGVMGELNSNIEESGTLVGILRFGFDDLWRAVKGSGDEIEEETGTIDNVAEASDDAAMSVESLAESQKRAEETAAALTNRYSAMLSAMFSVEDANKSYTETLEDLDKSDADLLAKKNRLIMAYQQETAANGQTSAGLSEYTANMLEVNQAIEENIEKRTNAAEDLEKASEQRKFDLVQERLGADGIISSGEFEYLQHIAVQKGLVSQAAADQAIAESRAADEIVAGFSETSSAMAVTLDLMMAIRANSGTVPFGVEFQTYGSPPSTGGSSFNAQSAPGGYGYQHATGGSFVIPTSAGYEGWPLGGGHTASGGEVVSITPAGKSGGNNVTININVGSMRNQQDLDYWAQEIAKRLTAV